MKPRVAMRLHDSDDMAWRRGAGGAQDGGDLDRMMAVIVENGGAVPFAGAGEAALDAAEARERLRGSVSALMPS